MGDLLRIRHKKNPMKIVISAACRRLPNGEDDVRPFAHPSVFDKDSRGLADIPSRFPGDRRTYPHDQMSIFDMLLFFVVLITMVDVIENIRRCELRIFVF